MKVRDVLFLLVVCSLFARWAMRAVPPAELSLPTATGEFRCLQPEVAAAPIPRPEPQWVAVRPSPDRPEPARPPDTKHGVPNRPPTSESVNGVHLGMSRAELEGWLGPGQVLSGNLAEGYGEVRYDRYHVRVVLGRNRVRAVAGTKLRFDGNVVLLAGDSRAKAIRALGECSSRPGVPDVLYDRNSHAVVYLRNGVVERIEIFSRC